MLDCDWSKWTNAELSLVRDGITVTGTLASALAAKGNFSDAGLRELFINNETGEVFREGDKVETDNPSFL